GDEMVAAEREELRPGGNDLLRRRLDRCRNAGGHAIVERAVAVVDDRQAFKEVEAERVLRIAVQDRRSPPDRLWPEAGARPVRRGGVEGDAEDHRIDAAEIAAVAPA